MTQNHHRRTRLLRPAIFAALLIVVISPLQALSGSKTLPSKVPRRFRRNVTDPEAGLIPPAWIFKLYRFNRTYLQVLKERTDERFKVEMIKWAKQVNAEYPDKTVAEKQQIIFAQLRSEGFNPVQVTDLNDPSAVSTPILKLCSEMPPMTMNGITAIGASIAGVMIENPSPCLRLTNVHTQGGLYGVILGGSPARPPQIQGAPK